MMPHIWKSLKVSEIATDIAMGPFGSNIKVDNFISTGVPVIRGSNLNPGGLREGRFVYVSEAKAESLKRCLAYPDDLVFTHRGTLGQIGIIPHGQYPYYLVSQSQMRLTVNKETINPKFLYYFFMSPFGQRELLKNASQVGVPAIANPTKSLKEAIVPVPSLQEQSGIVSILSSLDDKIELNLQMNKTLEAITQAIFKEWFVDFRFPGFDGELVNGLPKEWKIGTVVEIADLLSGGTPRTERKQFWNGNIKWISAKDITASNGGFILSTEKQISEEGLERSAAKLLPVYTTIVSARGTVGNYCIISEEMAISQSNYGLKAKGENSDFFLFLAVKNMIEKMKAYSYGTVFDTITTKTFKEIEIILPTLDKIVFFNKCITPMFMRILSNSQQTQNLKRLRDTLLPKLMAGKIRVT